MSQSPPAIVNHHQAALDAVAQLRAADAAGVPGARKLLGDLGAGIVRALAPPLLVPFRGAVAGWLAGHDTPGPDALVDAVVLGGIDAHGAHLIEAVAAGLDAIGEAPAAGAAP